MPYKDKEKQREAIKKAVARHRKGITMEGITEQGITPPVMKCLVPGEERKKMEAIVQSLKKHTQLPNVYLGCGKYSLPLHIVGEVVRDHNIKALP